MIPSNPFKTFNRRQNCEDTVLRWGNFGEQNNPIPSHSPPFEAANDCCFLQAARTAAEHCMDWMGGKIFIFPFLVGKTLERPFRAKSLD